MKRLKTIYVPGAKKEEGSFLTNNSDFKQVDQSELIKEDEAKFTNFLESFNSLINYLAEVEEEEEEVKVIYCDR